MEKKAIDKSAAIETGERSLVPRNAKSLADHSGEWLAYDYVDAQDVVEEKGRNKDPHTGDLYHSFARQMAKIKRLSEEEEFRLGMKIQKSGDSAAKKKLVLHNMRLALKMAYQYRRDWTNIMDLVQEASAGMTIAAKKWDPRMGTRFGTYAAYWIRAQLTKFLMTNARLIHTGHTRAGRKVYFSLPQIRRKLLLEGKKPTVELIAEEVGEDPKEVGLILSRLKGREASLSSIVDDSGSITLGDTIASENVSPDEAAIHNEMQHLIKQLIASFEKTLRDERDLAIWRENLIANEPINLVELGKRYGVSKQRMGQLATRIKRAFRRHIIDELGPNIQLAWLFRED